MEQNLIKSKSNSNSANFRKLLILSLAFLITNSSLLAQTCGFANFQFTRVTQNIHPLVGGFLWKKPSDYDAQPTKYYPTIIYWHGAGSQGDGSAEGLCNIVRHPFGGTPDDALPIKIQNGQAILTVTSGGQTYEYMVFCPQYSQYTYNPGNPQPDIQYPSAQTAAAVLQYLTTNYRVDPNRVYMSGMSAGANVAIEFAAGSTTNANKLAALTPVALCAINQTGAGNISSTNLPVWINHCSQDTRCNASTPQAWITAINAGSPNPLARLTLMSETGEACNSIDPFTMLPERHNAWPTAYRSSYRPEADNLNIYEWMIQFQRGATVPVVMRDYNVRLSNGKVYIDWSTSREVSASEYIIEKAGADQKFTKLTSLKAAGNSNNLNNYSFIDNSPAAGLNFYRVVQVDADQRKTFFETRKVMDSRNSKFKVMIYPNPVQNEITAFINPSKPQLVTMTLADINGKVVLTRSAFYKEGNTGISFSVSDLSKGIYFLRTSGEDFTDVQKVVKQ